MECTPYSSLLKGYFLATLIISYNIIMASLQFFIKFQTLMLINGADLSVARSALQALFLQPGWLSSWSTTKKKSIFSINHKGVAHGNHSITYMYSSVPGKRPLVLLGKHQCTAFQGATVAASIQTYGILIAQNCELRLSAHGRLPGTLWYIYAQSMLSMILGIPLRLS